MNFVTVAVIKVALSLIVTEIAWRCVERPILGLKRYFVAPGEGPRIAGEGASRTRGG